MWIIDIRMSLNKHMRRMSPKQYSNQYDLGHKRTLSRMFHRIPPDCVKRPTNNTAKSK